MIFCTPARSVLGARLGYAFIARDQRDGRVNAHIFGRQSTVASIMLASLVYRARTHPCALDRRERMRIGHEGDRLRCAGPRESGTVVGWPVYPDIQTVARPQTSGYPGSAEEEERCTQTKRRDRMRLRVADRPLRRGGRIPQGCGRGYKSRPGACAPRTLLVLLSFSSSPPLPSPPRRTTAYACPPLPHSYITRRASVSARATLPAGRGLTTVRPEPPHGGWACGVNQGGSLRTRYAARSCCLYLLLPPALSISFLALSVADATARRRASVT